MSKPIHIKITMERGGNYLARAEGYAEQVGASPDEAIGAMVLEIWLGETGDNPVISIALDINTDEYAEPTEPEEGDLVTEDHQHFYVVGEGFAFSTIRNGVELEWRTCAKEYMELNKFWPNVWWTSDHGNAHLLSLEDTDA